MRTTLGIAVAVLSLLALTDACHADDHWTRGTHLRDFRRIQGEPDHVDKYFALGFVVWHYGRSTVKISSRSWRVMEWDNYGRNLRVRLLPGRHATTATHFTRGSHRDDVTRLQGTPDEINAYAALGYENWEYGRSTVRISTRTGRVLEWDNYGNNLVARLHAGRNVTTASYFTRGSHRDDVVRLQGTPNEINAYAALGYENWEYGRSTVKISTRTRRVLEWDNYGRNLKVRLQAGRYTTRAKRVSLGLHRDDVLRLHGTPRSIDRYAALGYERWSYDAGTVTIGVRSQRVQDVGGRLAGARGWRVGASKIKYHHTTGGVTLLYDEDKVYAGAFALGKRGNDRVYGITREGVTYYYDHRLRPMHVASYVATGKDLFVVPVSESASKATVADVRARLSTIDITGTISATGTATRHGNLTFYDLMTDHGESIHGTSMDFDSLSFDDFYSSSGSSLSGGRMRVGDLSFGDWWTGSGTSISGSSQRIGGFVFHDYYGSDGSSYHGTTMEIGGTAFTDLDYR